MSATTQRKDPRKWAYWLGGCLAAVALGFVLLVVALRWMIPPAGESPVIGDLRTVNSAMAAYTSANGGLPDGRLGCLARPTDGCVPGYAADAPFFLEERITDLETRDGYSRAFHPGAGVPEATIQEKGASPTSVVSWAYVAIPLDEEAGGRSFCVDDTGVLRFQVDVRAVDIQDGRCPEDWPFLQ